MMVMTRSYFAALLSTIFALAWTGCTPDASGNPGDEPGESQAAAPERPTGEPDPYAHESLLAPPATPSATLERAPAEFLAELERLPVAYDLNDLPVIRDRSGNVKVAQMPAVPDREPLAGPGTQLNASTRAIYTVGGGDWVTYWYIEIPMPSYMTDTDGGTIRLVMQHEVDSYDQLRVIDEHIGTEYVDNTYGARGRFPGRYGWTRQSGGGEWSWILGDGAGHNLATPWDWAWIVDYRFLQNNTVLGGDYIRVYSHPHVTTRVVFMD